MGSRGTRPGGSGTQYRAWHCPISGAQFLAGHRSSIAFIISSAHRTASAIALRVAGTLFLPSNCASLRAARIVAAIRSTRLQPYETFTDTAAYP